MTQEDKDLLFRDLCGRLPYRVILNCAGDIGEKLKMIDENGLINNDWDINEVKPYLRSMSSMTEEEMKEYHKTFRAEPYGSGIGWVYVESIYSFDWLNKHGFDYRGLIPKGLVLEAPEGMYNNKR